MGDWPCLQQRELVTIHTLSPECLGPQMTAWGQTFASSFTDTSFFGGLIPFVVPQPIVVTKLWFYNGSVIAGSIDLGIYSEDFKRIVSTGPVAQAGASAVQAISVASTRIGPGRFYFAASGSGAGSMRRTSGGGGNLTRPVMGVLFYSGTTYPLPATITPSGDTNPFMIGLTGKAVI